FGDFAHTGRAGGLGVAIANAGPNIGSSPGSVSVLLNDGTGRLSPAAGSPFPSGGLNATGVVAADLNIADGTLAGIAVMNPGSTNAGAPLNTGGTTTTLTATGNANQTIPATVTVPPAVPGAVAPGGTVSITDGFRVL